MTEGQAARVGTSQPRKSRRRILAFWRRLSLEPVSLLGLVIVMTFVAIALIGPLATPYDPANQTLVDKLQGPNQAHPFGTDELGRDVLSRVLHGSRISMTAGLISVTIGLVIGVPLGLIAGYIGGIADSVIMRLMDALLSLPPLVLALAITAALGPSLQNALIAIGIVTVPLFARLTRGQALSMRAREFVEAARATGAGHVRIMRLHILPNVASPIIVQASLSVALAILTEASLSFLGLGVQPPTASWGVMVSTGKDYLDLAPWVSFAPGAAILMAVMGFNFLGDGLRDALDPRMVSR